MGFSCEPEVRFLCLCLLSRCFCACADSERDWIGSPFPLHRVGSSRNPVKGSSSHRLSCSLCMTCEVQLRVRSWQSPERFTPTSKLGSSVGATRGVGIFLVLL